MQEEIEQKSFNIMISTTKLSARTVLRAVKAAFRLYQSKASQGKQSVRTLLRQNRGVSSVEISKTGIRDLERYAKKYGIDYAIRKDTSEVPPRYLVFFKAPDAEAFNSKEVIETTLSFIPEKERKEAVKKSCQRCFQALRIDVNQEFEVLESFLTKLPGILAPGGRAAILTFHSGEDRLVKYYFKEGKKDGLYSDVANDVIRPSAEECQRNPRARSTKMRWAIREGENSHRN